MRTTKQIVSRVSALYLIDEPQKSRLRNYEIENRLKDKFHKTFVILDWCPYDGIFCNALQYINPQVIKMALKIHEQNKENGKEELDYNPDVFINELRDELKRRGIEKIREENN